MDNNNEECHSFLKVRCTKCGEVTRNHDSPICVGLTKETTTLEELPHCNNCGGLLRPHIVWFGENLDEEILRNTGRALDNCDCCLVVRSLIKYTKHMRLCHLCTVDAIVISISLQIDVTNFNLQMNVILTNRFNFLFLFIQQREQIE